jgi:hypothetical protein
MNASVSQSNTIVNLRKYQLHYEERMMKIIKKLDDQTQLKQADYKECEELARSVGRMNIRWKRLTSLIIESLVELDNATQYEDYRNSLLQQQIQYIQDQEARQAKDDLEEIKNMENLSALLKHFIARAESQQQQPDQQQEPQQFQQQGGYYDDSTNNDQFSNPEEYSQGKVEQFAPFSPQPAYSYPVTAPISLPMQSPQTNAARGNPSPTRRLSVPRYLLDPSVGNSAANGGYGNNMNDFNIGLNVGRNATYASNQNVHNNPGNGNAGPPMSGFGLSMADLMSPNAMKLQFNNANIRPINRRGSFSFQ